MRVMTCKHEVIVHRGLVIWRGMGNVLKCLLYAEAARVGSFAVIEGWWMLGPIGEAALAEAAHAIDLVLVNVVRFVWRHEDERGIGRT